MTSLFIEIVTLSTTDFKAAQDMFNANIFKFNAREYNMLMDLLDK